MPISSKEAVLLALGIITSAMLALFFKISNPELKSFGPLNLTIIIPIIITASFIIIIIYKRINELGEELDIQKTEQKRLSEKLKIYERLAKLEKKVFENG